MSANVSLNRIISFLAEPETDKYTNRQRAAVNDTHVGCRSATFDYGFGSAPTDGFSLQNITLSFPPGLSCIVGPVGSGKSTLLLSLLSERRLVHGTVDLNYPIMKVPGDHEVIGLQS